MEAPHPTSRRGPLVVAAGVVVLVLLLLALAVRTTPENPVSKVPDFSRPPPTAQPSAPQPSQGNGQQNPIPPELQDTPSESQWAKLISQIIVALLVIGGVGLAALVLFLVVRTVAGRQSPEGVDEADGDVVVDVVAIEEHLRRSTAELDVDGDVNQAIVRCWEGLEAIAKDAGAVRDPAHTAREFTLRVLRRAELPEAAMSRLADLYEAALFSGNELPARARDEAVRSLQDLREAMATRAVEVPVGAGHAGPDGQGENGEDSQDANGEDGDTGTEARS